MMHTVPLSFVSLHARDPPPIFPSDSNQGYKQMKAKIGSSRVRPWKWMPFTNPARKVKHVYCVFAGLFVHSTSM